MSSLCIDHISLKLSEPNTFYIYGFPFVLFLLAIELIEKVPVTTKRNRSVISYLALLTYPAYLLHQDLGLIFFEFIDKKTDSTRMLTSILALTLIILLSMAVNKYSSLFKKNKFFPRKFGALNIKGAGSGLNPE